MNKCINNFLKIHCSIFTSSHYEDGLNMLNDLLASIQIAFPKMDGDWDYMTSFQSLFSF
jgi:hypothetical protein